MQSRRERKLGIASGKERRRSVKQENISIVADILSSVPKETQIGSPVGSPMMNGIRRNISTEDDVIKNGKVTTNGVSNPAFQMDA